MRKSGFASGIGNVAFVALFVVALVGGVSNDTLAADDASPEPQFGTLQSRLERAAAVRAAGVELGTLELAWASYEPRPGEFDEAYIQRMQRQAQLMRDAGKRLVLDFGIQYPPDWLLAMPHARYVNQYGDAYNQDDEPGKSGLNGVFSAAVRERQAGYVARVFADFGGDFELVRLGWGFYGELQYGQSRHNGRDNCYWGFGEIAQGKAKGLPDGVKPCPVPGWKPGTPSEGNRDAAAFLEWYLASMQNYHDFQIAEVRKHFSGRLTMLYPSWGIRPGQIEQAVAGNLGGKSSAELNGEPQRASDFSRFIASIKDPLVAPCTTWLDSNPEFGDEQSTNPRDWSPAHLISSLAAENPLDLALVAENTGPGTKAAMELSFQRIRAFGIDYLMWAFEQDLFSSDPAYATIDDYAGHIEALRR